MFVANRVAVHDGMVAARDTPHRGILNLLLRCMLVSTFIGEVVCAVAAAMMHGGVVASLQSSVDAGLDHVGMR
jgi:hypothetical protein